MRKRALISWKITVRDVLQKLRYSIGSSNLTSEFFQRKNCEKLVSNSLLRTSRDEFFPRKNNTSSPLNPMMIIQNHIHISL